MSDLESLSIGTKFGTFLVTDARDPADATMVARLRPVDGKFKVYGKLYTRPFTLARSPYDVDRLYVSSDYSGELTDFAREKLLAEVGVVATVLPPLTRAEKVNQLVEEVERRSRAMLDYEFKALVANAAQRAGMSYGPDDLTNVERARLEQAQIDATRAWLEEGEQC